MKVSDLINELNDLPDSAMNDEIEILIDGEIVEGVEITAVNTDEEEGTYMEVQTK